MPLASLLLSRHPGFRCLPSSALCPLVFYPMSFDTVHDILVQREIPSLTHHSVTVVKFKTCGKCGSKIENPGPCAVCNDTPFGVY